jgi:ferredoxin-NADP reductase
LSIYLGLERKKRGWMDLVVADIVSDTPDTKTLIFKDPADGHSPIDYIAGQYLTFRFDEIADKPVVRSYTMSSSPRNRDALWVTVKIVPKGLVSTYLCEQVKVGDVLRARGPIGRFCYDWEQDPPHLFMVAGGSGVTPFLSIIDEYWDRLGQKTAPASLNLLVSQRSREDLIGKDLLAKAAKIPGIKIWTTLTREKADGYLSGHIEEATLSQFFAGHIEDGVFMTCGPDAIMAKTVAYLQGQGVAPERIKQESFFS